LGNGNVFSIGGLMSNPTKASRRQVLWLYNVSYDFMTQCRPFLLWRTRWYNFCNFGLKSKSSNPVVFGPIHLSPWPFQDDFILDKLQDPIRRCKYIPRAHVPSFSVGWWWWWLSWGSISSTCWLPDPVASLPLRPYWFAFPFSLKKKDHANLGGFR
jgi:hypothetical protein